MMRWLLLFQEFDIIIIDRPRKENIVSNFLPRLTNDSETVLVKGHFLDEHVFSVSTNVPWYAYIANYLLVGKLLDNLFPREKKQIIR